MAGRKNNKPQCRKIGLTGGIGSGKSSVAAFIGTRRNIEHIDSDEVCRALLEPGQKGWLALRSSLDKKYFNQDQTLNRSRLRHELFADPEFRSRINQLIHPLAREIIHGRTGGETRTDEEIIVVEIPLLFEAQWENDFDSIVVVYADRRKCLERIIKRDRISIQEAEAAIAAQNPLDDKAIKADHVIDNSGCWLDTCLQILHLEILLWEPSQKKSLTAKG